MEDFAKKYLAWYQGLSKVVRAILCLLWDVPSNLYRFSKSALKKNTLGICLAIVLAIFGGFWLFIIDLISFFCAEIVKPIDFVESENADKVDQEEPKTTENRKNDCKADAKRILFECALGKTVEV